MRVAAGRVRRVLRPLRQDGGPSRRRRLRLRGVPRRAAAVGPIRPPGSARGRPAALDPRGEVHAVAAARGRSRVAARGALGCRRPGRGHAGASGASVCDADPDDVAEMGREGDRPRGGARGRRGRGAGSAAGASAPAPSRAEPGVGDGEPAITQRVGVVPALLGGEPLGVDGGAGRRRADNRRDAARGVARAGAGAMSTGVCLVCDRGGGSRPWGGGGARGGLSLADGRAEDGWSGGARRWGRESVWKT